jgi:hypothetical protein
MMRYNYRRHLQYPNFAHPCSATAASISAIPSTEKNQNVLRACAITHNLEGQEVPEDILCVRPLGIWAWQLALTRGWRPLELRS